MVTRRAFVATTAAATAAACAPAAAPDAPSSGSSAGKAEWERQWDQLAADAKKEGKLGVLTLVGSGYRIALDEFEKAFPGISIEHRADPSASVWVPKVQKERQAGLYDLDVAIVPPNSALTVIKPEGGWDPLKPLVFRPDVLDDKAWRGGFNARWMDVENQLCFGWEYDVLHTAGMNTDQARESEVQSVKDLLDPKWRGKLLLMDMRVGDGFLAMANLRKNLGDDAVKQLLIDQQPTFNREPRQIAEALVRGRHPIATGMRAVVLKEFKEQGVARRIKILDLPELDFVPSTSLLYFNRAPHPNAAKLFINWFLTKEGQTVFAKNLPTNSARTDVESFNPDGVGAPGKQYYETGNERNFAWIQETQRYVNGLLGITN